MIDVGSIHDLAEGVPAVVRVNDREIGIVCWHGEVFAFKNVCPHQSSSFAGGHVRWEVVGGERPGVVELNVDEPVLVCPVHAWTYRLRSGHCAVDPRLRVRIYSVIVSEGRVLIDIDGKRDAR